MKPMTLQQRIRNYHAKSGFPESLHIGGDGRINGVWVMGNDYRVKSKYHGGYPNTYLRRIAALFPDAYGGTTLHLFSGKVDTSILPGSTVDINPGNKPDLVDNAQTLKKVFLKNYKYIFADPPYTDEDSNKYGTSPIKRNLVMKTLGARCRKGTIVCWLDQVLPMYRKIDWNVIGYIGVVRSTNHRFRIVTIFEHK